MIKLGACVGTVPASPLSVSNNGRFLTYDATVCTNTMFGVLRDRRASTSKTICSASIDDLYNSFLEISANGMFMLCQLTVTNRTTGQQILPPPTPTPTPQVLPAVAPTENPSDISQRISGTGRYVVYEASDIFRWDTQAGVTIQIDVPFDASPSTGQALRPDVSRDGTAVTFDSAATNLVPADSNGARDVFVRILGP